AGREEKMFAIEAGRIFNGMPYTRVIVDGSWTKRSYGHSYTALSGCAVVISAYTGKILYIGIRNKFCCICKRSENKGKTPPEHQCFRNWSGSASAMETDIIIEAFQKSISMHGVMYKEYVGDGDSSVFANIVQQ